MRRELGLDGEARRLSRLRLVVRMVGRDRRAGELRLLLAALIVAVTTVSTIALFVDRLHSALVVESSALLGADRIISGSRPIPDELEALAARRGLARASVMGFQTMIHTGERNQFVSVRAVSDDYPLRGSVRIADEPFAPARDTDQVPAPGEVWLDARLFPGLDIAPGDRVRIGMAELEAGRVLVAEPDRGGRLLDVGPRVLMHIDDVPATGVVQPGSRISYRLLLAGEELALERYGEEIEATLAPEYEWRGIRESSPNIAAALRRAESFLMLGGLLAVLLAGVAVALSARRYAERHYDHVAVLKTLGATPREIQWGYLAALTLLGAIGIAVGLLAGGVAHLVIIAVLRDFLPETLPAPGIRPLLLGAVSGSLCLLAFALPPIRDLRNVSPMRVIRREGEGAVATRVLGYGAGAAGILALLIWYTQDWWLTLWTLLGIASVLALFGAVGHVLLSGGHVLGMQAGNYWRLAMAGLRRRNRSNLAQILIFGLAIMLLLILTLTRTALLEEWQQQVPEDAPNHFVINVLPEEVDELQETLAGRAGHDGVFYPMIRGRIISVNGVEAELWQRQRGARDEQLGPGPALTSERNLSWTEQLPPSNRIVEGRWWEEAEERALISMEHDYARANGLGIGDVLELDIGGLRVRAEIASLRRLDWDSMQPNFFILFSPAALEDIRATYITSFHLPPEEKAFLNELLQRFPTLTVIEVDAILEQLRSIIGQVTRAVELVLALVLAAGCLVLIASIQASRDERLREHALVRTLGGSRRLILSALAVEFAALGLFAGLVAAFGAELTVYLLQTRLFGIDFQPHPWLWLAGPALGLVLILTVGLLGTRRLVNASPVSVLRELA